MRINGTILHAPLSNRYPNLSGIRASPCDIDIVDDLINEVGFRKFTAKADKLTSGLAEG